MKSYQEVRKMAGKSFRLVAESRSRVTAPLLDAKKDELLDAGFGFRTRLTRVCAENEDSRYADGGIFTLSGTDWDIGMNFELDGFDKDEEGKGFNGEKLRISTHKDVDSDAVYQEVIDIVNKLGSVLDVPFSFYYTNVDERVPI